MKELIHKRTEFGKSFDIGDGKEQVSLFARPVHFYSPKGYGSNKEVDEWEGITPKFDLLLSSKKYSSHYLSDKQQFSYGFRNDRINDKFYGIRKGEDNQLEGTLKSVIFNGSSINVPSLFKDVRQINDTTIEHRIDDNNFVHSTVDRTGFRSAVKTLNWVDNFEITERLDIIGFKVINSFTFIDGNKEYIPDELGCYILSNGEDSLIVQPASMWNLTQQCSNGIDHRLTEKNGELLYIKTPNKKGLEWMLLNKPPFYIDISVYKSAYQYRQYSSTVWSTARGGSGSSLTSNTCTAGVMVDKSSYFVYHGLLSFDLSSYSNYTISSPYLYVYGYNASGVAFNLNVYKTASTDWDVSTSNYVGVIYITTATPAYWSNLAVSPAYLTNGAVNIYRLRDSTYDVPNTDPTLTNYVYNYATFTDAYLSFTAVQNPAATFFGFNF